MKECSDFRSLTDTLQPMRWCAISAVVTFALSCSPSQLVGPVTADAAAEVVADAAAIDAGYDAGTAAEAGRASDTPKAADGPDDAAQPADGGLDSAVEVAEPDVDGVDAAGSATPSCAFETIQVVPGTATLVPPPLPVTLTANDNGTDVTALCEWHAGPGSVCHMIGPAAVRKSGDGTCTVVCKLADGNGCGQAHLTAKKQTVIYVAGGVTYENKKHSAQISRFRVADLAWDAEVAIAPEKRHSPTLAAWNGKLFLVGGYVPGSLAEFLFDPEFFPKCPEAVMDDAAMAPWLPVAGDGSEEGGCRAIRSLDLGTGTWAVAGQLVKNRWAMRSQQLGSDLFLIGGDQSGKSAVDSQWMYRVDLMSNKVLAPLLTIPQDLPTGIPVAWSDGLLFIYKKNAYYHAPYGSGSPDFTEIDIAVPCVPGAYTTAFRFPAPADNFFLMARESDTATCGPKYFQGPGPPYAHAFLRYHDKKWSWTPTFNSPDGEVVPVVAKDAVYLIQGSASTKGVIPPVLRLSSIDGDWEELPPMPYYREYFAAVAVEQ